jgi:hypothetical protein
VLALFSDLWEVLTSSYLGAQDELAFSIAQLATGVPKSPDAELEKTCEKLQEQLKPYTRVYGSTQQAIEGALERLNSGKRRAQ